MLYAMCSGGRTFWDALCTFDALHCVTREGGTCSEEDLWCNVVGRPHQRVRQAALVLPRLSPLQGLEAVGAAAVGRVLPVLAEVHAVLPHVVAWG